MFIRAKLSGFTRGNIIDFARDNGIRRPDAVIRDIASSLKNFRTVALKNGVAEEWIGRVESTIVEHLRAWGERKEDASASTSGCEFWMFRVSFCQSL